MWTTRACGGWSCAYNDELTGQNGRILTAKNAWGYDMPTHYQTLVEAVPGSTLTLTIDANIQHWLESALSAAVTSIMWPSAASAS